MNTRLNAKFLIVTALALFVSAQSILSQSEKSTRCVVKDIDTPTMPKCVIQPRNGELFIPKRYWMYPSFNQYGLAPFTILSFGRVYVNRTGRIVIRDVAFMDNAPDEFHHGLVRIEHEGKWGYADPTGKITNGIHHSVIFGIWLLLLQGNRRSTRSACRPNLHKGLRRWLSGTAAL